MKLYNFILKQRLVIPVDNLLSDDSPTASTNPQVRPERPEDAEPKPQPVSCLLAQS